jgi:hypothetical protein
MSSWWKAMEAGHGQNGVPFVLFTFALPSLQPESISCSFQESRFLGHLL